jgi:hypothetical protein
VTSSLPLSKGGAKVVGAVEPPRGAIFATVERSL